MGGVSAEKLGRLPKWAQEEIRHLKRAISHKDIMLDSLTGSELVAHGDREIGNVYVSYPGEVGYREIPTLTRVLFPSESGFIEAYLVDGTDVNISATGGWADMQVRPHVSNVISVRAAARK